LPGVPGDDVDGSGQKWSKRAELRQDFREVYPTEDRKQASAQTDVQEVAMFRGNHPTRVDEKGRLKMPAEFKRRVDELYGPQFYITSKDGKRAEIYPLKEWERIEEKLAQIPSMNPARKKFLDVTNYYGQVAEMDAQGRLLIPQLLRESAKVMGDVVVFGSQTFLEVVNHDAIKAEMEAAPMTEADQQALSEFGL
jgi:MraZ protein